MATSNSYDFTVTRDDIIKSALRTLGALGVGETPNAEDYANGSEALNIMIKSWVTKGFPLWCYQEIVIPQQPNIVRYPLGLSAGYLFSVSSTGGTGYTAGTWTAVGGTTGTNASGTYTVVGGVPDVFTIVNAGTAYTSAPTSYVLSGAGTGAVITGVISGVTTPKPLRIMNVFSRNSANLDRPLYALSRNEYDNLGNKFVTATPNSYYYDSQLDTGYLYIYNPASDNTETLYALAHRRFQDMDTGLDTFDFPQEWFLALKWGLAAELTEEVGVEAEKIQRIESKATMYLQEVVDFSVEEASVYFTISDRNR
jgi:hypothetical protein